MAETLVIKLDGKPFEASFLTDLAPVTCRALRAVRPIRGEIYHAMWSGPICLLNFDLGALALENATTLDRKSVV